MIKSRNSCFVLLLFFSLSYRYETYEALWEKFRKENPQTLAKMKVKITKKPPRVFVDSAPWQLTKGCARGCLVSNLHRHAYALYGGVNEFFDSF